MTSQTPIDPTLATHLDAIARRAGPAVMERAAAIRLLLLDVDGVMTDGGLIQGDDAQEHKRFHAHDTLGVRFLQAEGVRCGIVSGRASPTLSNRAIELGVDIVHAGCHDKRSALDTIAADLELAHEQIAFMGDDIVDLPPMRRVGLALAPADAHALAAANAHHVLTLGGGRAAVREAAELILHAQGKLERAFAPCFA